MSMKFRNVLGVAIAATMLAVSTGAAAGTIDKAAEKLRDQQSDQKSDQKSDQRSDSKQSAPAPRDDRARGSSQKLAPPTRGVQRDSRANDRRGPSIDLNSDLARLHGNHGNDRGAGGYDHRPPRVIDRLPSGYRDYSWNGNRYYSYGGRWYSPYGGSYISIGIPFGLFVTTLPGYYSSFWLGGTHYFYADDTYYLYEPDQRGYVITHSPYGDSDEESSDSTQSDELYIYPAKGQSEQQQADDRYQCHRWAVDQSHYDPLDDSYDAGKNAAYRRAMTACLTGRGYTVN